MSEDAVYEERYCAFRRYSRLQRIGVPSGERHFQGRVTQAHARYGASTTLAGESFALLEYRLPNAEHLRCRRNIRRRQHRRPVGTLTLLGSAHHAPVGGRLFHPWRGGEGAPLHDESMAFGEALVKAYQCEANIVRYPRVMVLSDVVVDTRQLDHLPNVFGTSFKQADDGPMFLHVLRKMQADMNALPLGPDNDETGALGEYARIKTMIEQRYRKRWTIHAILKKCNGSPNIGITAFRQTRQVFAFLVSAYNFTTDRPPAQRS